MAGRPEYWPPMSDETLEKLKQSARRARIEWILSLAASAIFFILSIILFGDALGLSSVLLAAAFLLAGALIRDWEEETTWRVRYEEQTRKKHAHTLMG